MHRFIDGEDRMQRTVLPNGLEDDGSGGNPVRVIEVFIDELDLAALGFAGMTPAATGRPAYHPSTLLKITSTAISTACSRAGGSNGEYRADVVGRAARATSRRLPTSGRTMAGRSGRCV